MAKIHQLAIVTSRCSVHVEEHIESTDDTFTQSFLHRAWPKTRGLQLASSSSAPRAMRCGKKKVLDQLTFGTSRGMTKPVELSLHEQCRYACKAEVATQLNGWHTVSAPYA